MEMEKWEPAKQELQPSRHLNDYDALLETLKRQMMKVGIRSANMPTAEEWEFLKGWVQKNYGQFSESQIDKAFDLAISGELPETDAKCFENFSCEYFGRIMAGFKKWLQKEQDRKGAEAFNQERQYKPIQIEAGFADWSDHLADIRKKVESGQNPGIIPVPVYDWLVRCGKIDAKASDSFIEAAKGKVKAELLNDLHEAKLGGQNTNSISQSLEQLQAGFEGAKISCEAKRLAVLDYVKNTL